MFSLPRQVSPLEIFAVLSDLTQQLTNLGELILLPGAFLLQHILIEHYFMFKQLFKCCENYRCTEVCIEMTTYKLFIYYLRHVFRQSSSLSWTTPGLFGGIFNERLNNLSIKQGQISFVIKEITGCTSFKSQ